MVTDVKEEHLSNASFPIVVIPSEMLTVVSFVLIVLGVTCIAPDPVNVNDVMLHPLNAPSPIVVTLFGMVIDVKEEQSLNASSPIVVTLFGMVMDVKEEHS